MLIFFFKHAAFCNLTSGHSFLSLTLQSTNTKSSNQSNKLFHIDIIKSCQAGSWPQSSRAANNGSVNFWSCPNKFFIQLATLTSYSAPHLCPTVNWDSELIIRKHIATLISARLVCRVAIDSRIWGLCSAIMFTCNKECETAIKLYSLFDTKGHNTV
jgi:hypothetical protein